MVYKIKVFKIICKNFNFRYSNQVEYLLRKFSVTCRVTVKVIQYLDQFLGSSVSWTDFRIRFDSVSTETEKAKQNPILSTATSLNKCQRFNIKEMICRRNVFVFVYCLQLSVECYFVISILLKFKAITARIGMTIMVYWEYLEDLLYSL